MERLTRLIKDKMIAGVCSGLGKYTNVDPVIYRLAFVISTIFWGLPIIVYLIMWIVIPLEDSEKE